MTGALIPENKYNACKTETMKQLKQCTNQTIKNKKTQHKTSTEMNFLFILTSQSLPLRDYAPGQNMLSSSVATHQSTPLTKLTNKKQKKLRKEKTHKHAYHNSTNNANPKTSNNF